MSDFFTFLMSVGAGIIANVVYDLIRMWLDRHKK